MECAYSKVISPLSIYFNIFFSCFQASASGPFPCTFPGCGAVFNHKSNRHHHMKRHQGIYAYQCPYCNKGLSATNDIKHHLKSHHTGLWGFHCIRCGTEFKNVHKLKAHLAENNCSGQTLADINNLA